MLARRQTLPTPSDQRSLSHQILGILVVAVVAIPVRAKALVHTVQVVAEEVPQMVLVRVAVVGEVRLAEVGEVEADLNKKLI
jgi:hypothetical protein